MPGLNYLTILKWIGVAALALAVIGIPIVYHNHQVSQAFEQGKVVGKAECEKVVVAEKQRKIEEQETIMQEEAARAVELQKKLTFMEKRAKWAEKTLGEELEKTPEVAQCHVNERGTDILRDAARGIFWDIDNALSSTEPEQMYHDAPVLKDKGNHSS